MGRLAAAGPLAWLVLALGLLAGVLMIATEFSTIQSVRIGDSTCGAAEDRLRDVCSTGGGEQHNWSLLVLGLLTMLLAFGAAIGRSKPAALALGFVGLVVLFVALVLDRPTLDDKRGLEVYFGEAGTKPETGGGYTLELIAGALALVACGLALLRDRIAPRAEERERGTQQARARRAAGRQAGAGPSWHSRAASVASRCKTCTTPRRARRCAGYAPPGVQNVPTTPGPVRRCAAFPLPRCSARRQ